MALRCCCSDFWNFTLVCVFVHLHPSFLHSLLSYSSPFLFPLHHAEVNKVSRMDYPDSHGRFPALCSASCLLKEIIHLALSIYTKLSGHTRTHTKAANTLIQACLHGWKVKLRGGKLTGRLGTEMRLGGVQIRWWRRWSQKVHTIKRLLNASKCFRPEERGDISVQKRGLRSECNCSSKALSLLI